MRNLHRDERGLITGFLVKAIIAFALLALVAEEGGQVIVTNIHASNVAGDAAQAAADTYAQSKNADAAKRAALASAASEDAKAQVTAIDVATDGSVTVTVVVTASTLVIQRVSFLRHYGVIHSTVTEIHSLA